MEIGKATAGVLAAFCVTAGAAGAYLALRSNETSPAAASTEAPVGSPAPSTPVAEQAEQAEAIINDETSRPVGPHARAPFGKASRDTAAPHGVTRASGQGRERTS